ncbi:MAG: hypothetical protein J4O06_12405, partial [Chloroflexi bacterium]|nr:hypothetical protein [Chloroflexota bacterium]
GETIQLAAQGFDLFKNPIEGLSFVWGAEGLAIDQTGKVTAGNQQGRYQVTASASYKGGRRTASVTVAVPPTWVSVGNMRARRSSHTATLLANGQVLVVGGGGGGAELYDPDGRTFSFTGSPICSHGTQLTSTVLADGNILITGGSNAPRCAEIYNADTGNFSRVGELNAEHRRHSATLLSDGRVLIAGGDKFEVGGDVSQDIAEIFDPATETFTLTGSLNVHRNSHAATLLPSGQVLITSGRSGKFPKGEVQHECLGDPELYDPISGTFSLMGGPKLRSNCTGRSMVLNSGIVLLPSDGGSANLFDPANQTFRFTGIVRANRGEYTNTLLSSGQVLITGGWQRIDSDLPPFATAEVYNPATRTFAFIDSMIGPRRDHAAVLLPDGSVLVTGGRDGDGSLRTAEIWIPGKAR